MRLYKHRPSRRLARLIAKHRQKMTQKQVEIAELDNIIIINVLEVDVKGKRDFGILKRSEKL